MNRLQYEKSPYLLQHAGNTVDWFPWGDEAFHKAKSENKPIFLSIGYSTCHWCHVMERESFENPSVASIMNAHFVNIKVDREERPDVDKVYMSAVQTMIGQGGWPLSVFLTPDLKPFYGGTYFPPKDGYGRPSFLTLLERIHEVWVNERENVIQSGDELIRQLQHRQPVDPRAMLIDESILKRTYHQIAAGYDTKHAGFGSGTKFPRPVVFNFLFRYHHRTNDHEALTMSLTTLMAMASGGMYDHLGGGFHRYSVDPQWRVPHFEKMLYDQAQLIQSYLDAFLITRDPQFAAIAEETAEYVLREMQAPEGGFYSAEDADSADPDKQGENVEGAFYVWKKSEIDRILNEEESRIFCYHYSVEEQGNVLSDPHKEFVGKNILFNPWTVEQTAHHFSKAPNEVQELLEKAKQTLFTARRTRTRPLRDEKIIASWNGLVIGALSRAARVLKKAEYLDAARKGGEFITSKLLDNQSGKLRRRYKDGEAKFEAHLDDYAFVGSGFLELFRSTQDRQWLQFAEKLFGTAIVLFWDSAEGGFFDTSGKDSSILVRTKEAYDGAEPTGNSVMAMSLMELYHHTNEPAFRDYAEKTLRYFCTLLEQSPQIMPHLMAAVDYFLTPPEHLMIVKSADDQQNSLALPFDEAYHPNVTVIVLERENRQYFEERFPMVKSMPMLQGKSTAYLCKNFACQLPTNSVEEVRRSLSDGLKKESKKM